MFSKTIYKQTLKQNWKLWAISTALTTLMSAAIIASFDPRMIALAMEAMGDEVGGRWALSLVTMLAQSFYGMQGILLPLVYVIMTANSLVATQIDRGSMAYTLSTPIKRSKIISTQAVYLITALLAMFTVLTVIGLGTVQLVHNGIFQQDHTPDVIAAAEVLDVDRDFLADRPPLIMNNPEALAAGAAARGIDEEVYTIYLGLRLMDILQTNLYQITGMEQAELMANPEAFIQNEEAIAFMADLFGFSRVEIDAMIENALAEQDGYVYNEEPQYVENGAVGAVGQEMLMIGIAAAADYFGIGANEIMANLGLIKDHSGALTAAVDASGLEAEMILTFINHQLALNEIAFDEGFEFSVADYVNLNIGIFLLMFATSAISFMFSCIFNLTKNSLIFGAGIPMAFLVIEIMSQANEDFERLRYLSLNTMFDPSAITGGGTFIPQFIVLAVLGVILYTIGISVFKKKDLPL